MVNTKEIHILIISLFTFLFASGGCNQGEKIKSIEKSINSANDIIAINRDNNN